MSDLSTDPITPVPRSGLRESEEGFLLVGVILMIALVLLVLSVAAPIVAKDLRRERELEAVHRAQQYTRAIRLYYQKFNSYPASVKQLEKTNNIRYLRQHYLDPITGKDDWRLIGFGQAKTTVKDFSDSPLRDLAAGAGSGVHRGFSLRGRAGIPEAYPPAVPSIPSQEASWAASLVVSRGRCQFQDPGIALVPLPRAGHLTLDLAAPAPARPDRARLVPAASVRGATVGGVAGRNRPRDSRGVRDLL